MSGTCPALTCACVLCLLRLRSSERPKGPGVRPGVTGEGKAGRANASEPLMMARYPNSSGRMAAQGGQGLATVKQPSDRGPRDGRMNTAVLWVLRDAYLSRFLTHAEHRNPARVRAAYGGAIGRSQEGQNLQAGQDAQEANSGGRKATGNGRLLLLLARRLDDIASSDRPRLPVKRAARAVTGAVHVPAWAISLG